VLFLALLLGAARAYVSLSRQALEHALEKTVASLATDAHFHAESWNSEVEALRRGVAFFASVPPIPGIARALKDGGVDQAENTPLDLWKTRLANIFAAAAKTNPGVDVAQIRLIGLADGGREMVRVDRTADGTVTRTPEAELQPKGGRPYVQEGLKLAPGEIYLSPIELNQEHGKIELPETPVIRAVTPVTDAGRKVWGLIVLNVRARPLLAQMQGRQASPVINYLTDARGHYLSHPSAGRAFQHERETDAPGFAEEFATVHDASAAIGIPVPAGIQVLKGPDGQLHVMRSTDWELGRSNAPEGVRLWGAVPFPAVQQQAWETLRPQLYAGGAGLGLFLGLLGLTGYAKITREITEIRGRQDADARTLETLRQMVEQLPSRVAMFDRQMVYLAASRNWIESFGGGLADLAGHNLYDIHPTEMPEYFKVAHRAGLAGHTTRRDRDPLVRPGGAWWNGPSGLWRHGTTRPERSAAS